MCRRTCHEKEQTLERRADLKLVIAQMVATITTIRRPVANRRVTNRPLTNRPATNRQAPARYARCTSVSGRCLPLCRGVAAPFSVVFCLNWGRAISRLLTTGIQACAKACHVVFAMSPPPIGHGFLGCPIPVTPFVKRGSPIARLPIGGCRL